VGHLEETNKKKRPTSRPGRDRFRSPLRSHVGYVDVGAGVDVVKRVPAIVIGVFIDGKVIGAIPAPIGADGPIPRSDFKIKAAGKPESVANGIETLDAIAVGRAKVFEAAVFEGMIEVKAPIVWGSVAVPVVIVDVLSGIDVTTDAMLHLGFGMRTLPFRRRRWNVALVGTRRTRAAFLGTLR
jgi:hypothetical protein